MQVYVQPEILIEGENSISIYSGIEIELFPNAISYFKVSIPAGKDFDIAGFFSENKKLIGKKITLVLKSGKNKEDHLTFTALIAQVSFSKNQGLTPELVIKAFDPSKILDGPPNTRSFSNMSVEDVFEKVTKPYPKSDLKIKKSNVRNTLKFDYLVQYQESDYNFLRRIASESGNWLFYNGKELFFGNPQKEGERKIYLGNTISEFSIDFNTQAFKSKTISHNYRKSDNPEYETKDSDLKTANNKICQDLVGASAKLFSTPSRNFKGDEFPDVKSIQEKSKIEGESLVSNLVVLNGKGRDPSLVPGNFISIFSPIVSEDSGISSARKKGDTAYGSYMILESSYEIHQGGELFSNFRAVSASVTAPPNDQNFQLPKCENQPAEVIENEDPEGLGRVKVKFFWQESDGTPWLRTNAPLAGKEYGLYIIPEIGDHVLVGFEDHNPDKPFVIGSAYHNKANQKSYQEKGNNVKTIKTRTGNEIKLYDKSGEEEIIITSPSGKNKITLTLKDEVNITLFSENIHLEAKKITINGEDSVKITSKKVEIEGQNEITMKSNKIESKANNSYKVASSNSMELKGLTGKVEASTQLELKGGVMAKLEGGAQTIVKGGIVMIN